MPIVAGHGGTKSKSKPLRNSETWGQEFERADLLAAGAFPRIYAGEVEMLLNDGGLDDDQVEEGWVLTCQTRVCSAGVQGDYPDAD